MHEVSSVLDAAAIPSGRTAYQHPRCVAQASRIPGRRVDEVLEIIGLTDVAHRRVGVFSLGMSQRLDIATALLGTRQSCSSTNP